MAPERDLDTKHLTRSLPNLSTELHFVPDPRIFINRLFSLITYISVSLNQDKLKPGINLIKAPKYKIYKDDFNGTSKNFIITRTY